MWVIRHEKINGNENSGIGKNEIDVPTWKLGGEMKRLVIGDLG